MQILSVQRKEIDYKEFVKRPAAENDYSRLITEDTILELDGKPVALYFKFTEDTSNVVEACKNIKYETTQRSGGLMTTSRIFGYDPKTGIRKPFCSATSLAIKNPRQHRVITEFSKKIAEIYQKYLPEAFQDHQGKAKEKIKEQWIIKETPFTSGIINKNNQLNYHFDSGNFKGIYSNMIVFKNNVAGGYLSMPEFDTGLQCADNTMVMFDGQSIMHGVTPIKMFSDNAYRYSIVYYTLEQMWKCNDITEELAAVRNRRDKIEHRNAKLNQ